jgi:hypothetical protein
MTPLMDETRPAAREAREALLWRNGAIAVIVGFALARAAFAYALGFGIDESYTVAISRRLSLSYFDHPPLHQWLTHFAALLLGEGPSLRLPFVALFAATGWMMFALTRLLFGARAGALAVLALNASPFFFVAAGSWIVPDGPLLFALAAAALCFARLFFAEPAPGGELRLWLCGGFWLGVAGLSKYSAALAALGLVAFIALSPDRRRWLARREPWLAGLIAVAMVSPVFIWNAANHWLSFGFQAARGVPGAGWRPAHVGAMLLGELLWYAPWIFAPLVGGLIAAARRPRRDERRLFLLCLALPPIVLFNLTPLWGARGLPHWPAPGWFFAYPLLGAWLAEGWASRGALRGWAIGSTAALGVAILALVGQGRSGWLTQMIHLPPGATDPTLQALSWRALARAPLIDGQGEPPPAFVVATKWTEGGKIAIALGPHMPVMVFSGDPRGFAFLDDSARFVGKDAVIIVDAAAVPSVAPTFQPYFASLGAPQTIALGRDGADEIGLALIPAHGLTRPFPLPYPR